MSYSSDDLCNNLWGSRVYCVKLAQIMGRQPRRRIASSIENPPLANGYFRETERRGSEMGDSNDDRSNFFEVSINCYGSGLNRKVIILIRQGNDGAFQDDFSGVNSVGNGVGRQTTWRWSTRQSGRRRHCKYEDDIQRQDKAYQFCKSNQGVAHSEVHFSLTNFPWVGRWEAAQQGFESKRYVICKYEHLRVNYR